MVNLRLSERMESPEVVQVRQDQSSLGKAAQWLKAQALEFQLCLLLAV